MTKKANNVYKIHFGMAKHNRDLKTKINISYCEHKSLSGMVHYMSTNIDINNMSGSNKFVTTSKVLATYSSTFSVAVYHGMVSRL